MRDYRAQPFPSGSETPFRRTQLGLTLSDRSRPHLAAEIEWIVQGGRQILTYFSVYTLFRYARTYRYVQLCTHGNVRHYIYTYELLHSHVRNCT